MTELAVSVRFQAHSSVLAGSAPAANYKPTHPPPAMRPSPAHIWKPMSHQTPAWRRKKIQVRLSKQFPRGQLWRGGAEIEMGALEDVMGLSEMPLFAFRIQVWYMAVSFTFWSCLAGVAPPDWAERSCSALDSAVDFERQFAGWGADIVTQRNSMPLGKPHHWPKVQYQSFCLSLLAQGAGTVSPVSPTPRQRG